MFGTSGQVFVYNKTKETFLAFRVNIADSITGRLIGLLGRRSLKPDSGVWIVPANAIHTVGMMFSFDVVMIDKDFKVVCVKEMVKPFRIVLPKLRAESVIELPPHTILRRRTRGWRTIFRGCSPFVRVLKFHVWHGAQRSKTIKFGVEKS
jgi:uncharacterized protein